MLGPAVAITALRDCDPDLQGRVGSREEVHKRRRKGVPGRGNSVRKGLKVSSENDTLPTLLVVRLKHKAVWERRGGANLVARV